MKKLMFLCVALLVVPAIAEVQFIFNDDGGGKMTISYTTSEGDLPRGIALHLEVTSGDGMITGYEEGSADDKMNCFIDYAYSNDPYDVGMEGQHPLADPAGPGELVIPTEGVAELSICMGALDQSEQQLPGDPDGVVATLTYTGGGLLTISADTLRGPDSGVVGSELTSNLPLVDKAFGGDVTCRDVLTAAEQVVYDNYITAGFTDAQMACWCWKYQCRADADNVAYLPGVLDWQIYQSDLNIMIANWKATYSTIADPCADFDHQGYLPGVLDWMVYQGDLNILIANWKKTPAQLVDCPSYLE